MIVDLEGSRLWLSLHKSCLTFVNKDVNIAAIYFSTVKI